MWEKSQSQRQKKQEGESLDIDTWIRDPAEINNIDYVSGDTLNSLHTAVVHAKQWLYAKFLNGVSKKGTSRFYKTN
ncbi:hypothetical protein Glove_21g58 [Diversispora epigaea]|uniref:Uncharacterized protein n=1 Tax=Diversispora epigaea TaxID=1348612 RepID=A0A397JW97_9GLOM|nr:hypothetical protein Glove_21g58 [Diversispora epigaea]